MTLRDVSHAQRILQTDGLVKWVFYRLCDDVPSTYSVRTASTLPHAGMFNMGGVDRLFAT